MYRLVFFIFIKLYIIRRILSTTFIPTSHGKIRFLQSKKKQELKNNRKQQWGIDSWNQIPSIPEPGIGIGIQKFRNRTALLKTSLEDNR